MRAVVLKVAATTAITAMAVATSAATSGVASAAPRYAGPVAHAPDAAAAAVLAAAKARLGMKYLYGATGPSSFDCSGLTSTVWRTAGQVSGIPRTSAAQQAWAVPVPAANLLPGDLIFFGAPVSHVGLALGGGWILDASSSHGSVVARELWPDPTLRYGRVPRRGMPAVRGVAPARPAPKPTSKAPARSKPKPAPRPTARPKPRPAPTSRSGESLTWRGGALVPARSSTHAVAGSARAVMLARIARTHRGARFVWHGRGPGYDDVTLVTESYRHATGRRLPASRRGLAAAARTVSIASLRTGDLVFYGSLHVGIYLGRGYMVDASLSNGRVLIRRVYSRGNLRLARVT